MNMVGAPGLIELLIVGLLVLACVAGVVVLVAAIARSGGSSRDVVQTCPHCGTHIRGRPVDECPTCGARLAGPSE